MNVSFYMCIVEFFRKEFIFQLCSQSCSLSTIWHSTQSRALQINSWRSLPALIRMKCAKSVIPRFLFFVPCDLSYSWGRIMNKNFKKFWNFQKFLESSRSFVKKRCIKSFENLNRFSIHMAWCSRSWIKKLSSFRHCFCKEHKLRQAK